MILVKKVSESYDFELKDDCNYSLERYGVLEDGYMLQRITGCASAHLARILGMFSASVDWK